MIDSIRDKLAEAVYAGGAKPEWLTTVDGTPNAASYELVDRVLAVLNLREETDIQRTVSFPAYSRQVHHEHPVIRLATPWVRTGPDS